MMQSVDAISLNFQRQPPSEMAAKADAFADAMTSRRSVRHFSADPIPVEVVEQAIRAASQAPSGANKQPWTFALVTNGETKRRIRAAAEAEEREFYGGRAPQSWLDDLAPFGTDANKPFLEHAPALVVVFARHQGADGGKNYYVKESVGLATGILLAGLHLAGLATLTHTPSPMGFLGEILQRPKNEKAFLLIPVGYPAADCQVPAIERRCLNEVLVRYP